MNFWTALTIIVVAFFAVSIISYVVKCVHEERMRKLVISETIAKLQLAAKEEKNKKGKTKKDEDGKVK